MRDDLRHDLRDDLLDVRTHLDVVRSCAHSWKGDPLVTATPDGKRYPLVYPRDTAAIARAYDRLHRVDGVRDEESSAVLRGAARFLADVQREDGTWAQRYDGDGRDRSLYPQEDNTAHAVGVLARHVRHERAAGRVSPFEEEATRAVATGLRASHQRLLSERLGLYRSTTSVHESRIERGWTLYVNGAYHDALRLAIEAARAVGDAAHEHQWGTWLESLRSAMRRHLVRDGRFIRRLTPEMEPDPRPDVTLLAPSYFRFEDLDQDAEAETVEWMEDALWDEDLGLLKRYPPDHDDMGVHLHGGDGPYLSFSSWLAQRHAANGRPERARDVVTRILSYATPDGALPEHAASRARFDDFMAREYRTGLDARKEFDADVLLPGVPHEAVLREGARMTAAYLDGLRKAEEAGDGVMRTAVPHAWTHAEVALALAMLGPREARRAAEAGRQERAG